MRIPILIIQSHFKKKKSFSSSLERSTFRIRTSKDSNAHRQHNPCLYKTFRIKRVFSVCGPNDQHWLSLVSTDDCLLQCSIEMNKMRIPVKMGGKERSRVPEFPILLSNFGSITAGSSEERKWELSFITPAWQTHPAQLLPGTWLLNCAALLGNSHLLTDGWLGCEFPH